MSPSLDYSNGSVPPRRGGVSIAEAFRRRSFYNCEGDRRLVLCPDCGRDADVLFGDHGGDCTDGAT